ncbi:Threonine dehydratase [Colletotrichum gloeosporioides]|uniref:Threonine dehydratase n=1 Tax=Colletotrichum gloeosporioides TaxID=474922 RepID=A0A8H4CV97_COLGL|nr:Threonine dehydratase [Colletotrichum gloeosporioides]KAF3810584.1 Threonine dehydratase [Colletotrichum gloeosporioides]
MYQKQMSMNRIIRTSEESLENTRLAAVLPRVSNLGQERLEIRDLVVGADDAREHLGHVAAVVSVVEQADVELGAQRAQELLERTGALGEVEHVEPLVRHVGAPADEVADVALGELVAREVRHGHVARAQALEERLQLLRALRRRRRERDADEHVGDLLGRVAVRELGHGVWQDGVDEVREGAGAFGDADGEQGLLALAERGALRDEAQAVEVHVGARGDGDHGALAVARVLRGVLLEAGDGQRAGGLEARAGVVVHVLDGGADLVGGDLDDLVDDVLADTEGFLADGLDGGAVGEEADVVEDDALALGEGLHEGVGVIGLDADDLDVGRHALDVDADAGDEAAAADAAEDGVELGHVDLAEELHADGALAGDDVGVVEGGDVDEAVLGGAAGALLLGSVEVGAVEHDVAAEPGDVEVLDARGGLGHDDGGRDLELAGRVGDALGVVAGGAADDALPADGGIEVGHLVVGAAQLEAEDGLLVLALEEDVALEAVGEIDGRLEGGDFAGFVDAGGCGGDEAEVL